MRKPPKPRKPDAKGRSSGTARHIRLFLATMKTAAWRSLKPAERAVLIELLALYNGRNNGEIFLSAREASERCRINKDTVTKVFRVLQERGFIKRRCETDARWSEMKARCWVLTEYPLRDGVPPTRDYQDWRPSENSEPRPSVSDKVSPHLGQADAEGSKIIEICPPVSDKRAVSR